MVNTELGGILEDRLEVIYGLRKTLTFRLETVLAQESVKTSHMLSIMPMRAHPIESRSSNSTDALLKCAFRAPAAAQFHRPE